MLIGFLCRDEKDWLDFRKRVADVCLPSFFFLYSKADLTMSSLQLPRTIFSVQDEMPTWPSDSVDSIGLESISEPDDMDLDDDEINDDGAGVGVVDDNEAEEEEEEEGEVVEFDDEGAGGEEEVDSENFFDTLSGSASTSNTSAGSPCHRHKRLKSEDVDTEEDPVGPLTPGPNSRFDIVVPSVRKGGREEKDADEYRGFEDDEDDGSGDDIEDDWIDPSLPSPPSTSRPGTLPLPKPLQQPQPLPPTVPMKIHGSPSVSSSSSSSSPPVLASKSKSSSSKQSSSTSNLKVKIGKSKKQIPVPVPHIRLLAQQQQQPQEQHYPFPVAPVDGPWVSSPQHRVASSQDRGGGGGGASNGQGNQRNSAEIATTEKRMHNARARDGGRTQSGGVKGILPEG
jgi:cysteine protease ATG4